MRDAPVRWIVAAHRAGARIFRSEGQGGELCLESDIDHPEGRLRNQEIDSDRAGSTWSVTGQHTRLNREQSATAREHEIFCKSVASMIERGAADEKFDELVLVAESQTLGGIRGALGPLASQRLRGTVEKDYVHLDGQEIGARVEKELGISRASSQ